MLLPCSVKLLTRLSYSGYSNQLYGLIDDEDVPLPESQGNLIKWKLPSHSQSLALVFFLPNSYSALHSLSLFCSLLLFHSCGTCILQSCLSVFCLLLIPFLHALSLPCPAPSLAAFTCWKTHLSPQCNCKPFVIASACGCGRGSCPFFDTIKFPCRLILNARRILIIFIENAL